MIKKFTLFYFFIAIISIQGFGQTGYGITWYGTGALGNGKPSTSTGEKNSAFGFNALYSNSTGSGNSASGSFSLYSNTTGSYNTASGSYSLYSNTTGNYNVAGGSYALVTNTTGSYNTANGFGALWYNTEGSYNTAIGFYSLISNTTGYNNTASGYGALGSNTTGNNNTAHGMYSLRYNTTGNNNTSNGIFSLFSNTTGNENTANGFYSLYSNTSGVSNTANGSFSLTLNTTGIANTANGYAALYANTTGTSNTSVGAYSLTSNLTGHYNTATGFNTLALNTTGNNNTATGVNTLYSNTTGSMNVSFGNNSLRSNVTGGSNTAIGDSALFNNTSGNFNTAIGKLARVNSTTSTSLSNATAIGYGAVSDANNKIRIGNTAITSIGGQVGWTKFSDGRYKENIKENVPGLAFIRLLRPVTYQIKQKELNEKIYGSYQSLKGQKETLQPETGFLAQEVEKAAQKIGYSFSGVDKPEDPESSLYGLRYDEFVVPLVKSVQELAAQNDSLSNQNKLLERRLEKIEKFLSEGRFTPNTKNENDVNLISTQLANQARLEQNTPNPFSNSTSVEYFIPEHVKKATIQVTDMVGRTLQSISINKKGNGQLLLNTAQLTTGTYYYSLLIDGQVLETRKMILKR